MASADEIPLAPAPVQDVPAPAASPGRTAEDAAAARSEWAAMLFVAAIEPRGKFAVALLVFFDIGVHQI